MPRPPSITAFERLYLASTVVYLLDALLFWSSTRARMMASTRVGGNPAVAPLMTPIMIGSLVVALGVSVLLWLMVARWRMVAGKWLVVVTEVLGGLFGVSALIRLVGGHSPNPGSVTVGLVSTALAIAAAAMLFRPDAKAWFAGARGAATVA